MPIQHDDENAPGMDDKKPSSATSSAPSSRMLPRYKTRRFTVLPLSTPLPSNDGPEEMPKRPSAFHIDILSISKVYSSSSAMMSMVVPLLIAATILIPMYCIPMIIDGDDPSGQTLMPIALAGISILPATLFLGWVRQAFHQSLHLGGFSTNEKDAADEGLSLCQKLMKCASPSIEGLCLPLAMMFRHAMNLVPFHVSEEYEELYSYVYSTLLIEAAAMCLLVGWISLLDSIYDRLLDYAKKVDGIAVTNSSSQKFKSIMKSFSGHENSEKDEAHAIPGGHQSAARVLADIVGIYCNIGKVLGLILLVLVFLGIDIYSSLVALGLTVLLAGVVSTLHINEAFKNVVSLVISNAIHIGEIISIGRSGFTPGDSPETHVVGFVEGITWTHIIIRDFKRKQTFIRHDEFGKLTMHNWSRRPTKHAHFIIPIVAELSGGADRLSTLANFTTRWLKEHKMIDQDGYQKAVIKLSKEKGLILEVIFFPARGAKARQIRSEFVVMILDAAKRYNLCLMPAEVRSSSPWPPAQNDESTEEIYMDTDLEDLLPSSTLTERAGYKPKDT